MFCDLFLITDINQRERDTKMDIQAEYNLNNELHLFLIWHNAKGSFHRIINDLEKKLLIVRVFEIQWDQSLFVPSLIAFYSHSQSHLCLELYLLDLKSSFFLLV